MLFFLVHFLTVNILNSTMKFICTCCGFGGLSTLRKKQTLCQTNHSVYMYKISKGWGRLTIVQNVETKHKEIKLPVLSTLGCADKVSAQESTEGACGRAGHRHVASGVSEAELTSANAQSAAKLSTFFMRVTAKNLNYLPQPSIFSSLG